MTPRVSIVMPVYNGARFIGAAIESVLSQDFQDWELIVVDDGSTDGTAEIVNCFADPRIRYIHQENQGLSAARNTGIRHGEGTYLAFLDADDEWEPSFLRRCVDILDGDETLAGVYTRNLHIDPQGSVLPHVGGQALSRDEFYERNLEGGFFPINAVVIRAAVVREVGLFDTTLTSEEDWDLWWRIAKRYPLQGIAEPLARYRVYAGSMSTDAGRMHENRIRILGKYFGPPEGDVRTWPSEKRKAYGFALRGTTCALVADGKADEGWRYLAQAVATWPDLLGRLDTFYELACGDQPRGMRGQADMLDIEANGAEMLRRLEALFAGASPDVQALRRVALGNAYLALAMLSDQAGCWRQARRYLVQAARYNPGLLSISFLRRLLKLCMGSSAVRWLKSVGASKSN